MQREWRGVIPVIVRFNSNIGYTCKKEKKENTTTRDSTACKPLIADHT